MYHAQRDHEKQWWQGREALLKQQAARGEGRKKLGELLCVNYIRLRYLLRSH
jgi:hypothetical protein